MNTDEIPFPKGFTTLILHQGYFHLRKPIGRRLYELTRKYGGKQGKRTVGLALLQKKWNSRGSLQEFRQILQQITKHQHLPDYRLRYWADRDQVTFHIRNYPTSPDRTRLF